MADYYWLDFDNEMNYAVNGDVLTMQDVNAVFNSLRNIVSTLQGSRRMLPDFAVPLYRLLFEPIDVITARKIADLLFGAIIRWEPRIELEGLNVVAYPDSNLYLVEMEFKIVGALNNQEVYTLKEILRAV